VDLVGSGRNGGKMGYHGWFPDRQGLGVYHKKNEWKEEEPQSVWMFLWDH